MESKKGCGTVQVHPTTTTDTLIYDRDASAPRRMTHRIGNSADSNRNSSISIASNVNRSASVSCVTRSASADDCAKQRFIVWAAVKRNKSVRMVESARLRCPLFKCGEQFSDHEAMLRHLSECQHLESGEYFCYECLRLERFNDGKCRCCLGQQSKRRRILNAAKKVFSTLGHKSRKNGSSDIGHDDFTTIPPPSYESLGLEPELPLLPVESEISGNPLCEMAAEPTPPVELGAVNYEARYEIPQTCHEAHSFSRVVSPFVVPQRPQHTFQSLQINNGSRPSLTLDTHNTGPPSKVARTKYLSPSSSLRSANSSHDFISPISAGSAAWTHGSTIDTTLASPITPFSSEVESSSLSRENSCKFPKDFPLPSLLSNWSTCPDTGTSSDDNALAALGGGFTMETLPELPGDYPLDEAAAGRSWKGDSLFPFESRESFSWSSTVDTTVNVLFTGDSINPDTESEGFGSDTTALIHQTWDALKEQMACSMPNIGHLTYPLARQLHSLSQKDIALRGLASLESILNGIDPTEPLDYLCFVHVVYALSLIIHEEGITVHLNKLFKQALAYQGFVSARDRDGYAAIVATVWEPDTLNSPPGQSSNRKGKDPELRANSSVSVNVDPLIDVARNFLDDVEMSVRSGDSTQSLDIMTSDLYSVHVAETGPSNQSSPDAYTITVSHIVNMLIQRFGALSDDLAPKLGAISRKVANGYIGSVRSMELEVLQTGKNTLPSLELFDEYIPEVRRLCGPLYDQRSSISRTKYHILGIALISSMIQNLNAPSNPTPAMSQTMSESQRLPGFTLDIPEYSDSLSADFWKDFDTSVLMNSLTVPPGAGTCLDEPGNTLISPSCSIPDPTPPISSASRVINKRNQTGQVSSRMAGTNQTRQSETPVMDSRKTASTSHLPIDPAPPTPLGGTPKSSISAETGLLEQKAEANDCCDICGYRPKGDPQWFKGSMAKHKKLQHSAAPPKIYKCQYPGCTSAYKNRPDNLRQHQIEKGHLIEGDGKQKRSGKRKKPEED